MTRHVRHHARFYGAMAIGVAAWVGLGAVAVGPWSRIAVAGDVFFLVYLVSVNAHAMSMTPDALRARARYDDEGIVVILFLTVAAFVLCSVSIVRLLAAPHAPSPVQLLATIASVPLGWLTLHTVMALRYAHLFYARVERDGERRDAGGLIFPGTPEPTAGDFLYYSYVVGMTAQVSDVQVTSGPMRQTTLAHGITSFFYNAVLLALAVNVAAGSGR